MKMVKRRDQEILEARARRIALPLVSPESGGMLDLLLFVAGKERFALETRYAREVVREAVITPLAGAEPYMGVTALRGDIVPVLQPGNLFGRAGIADPARQIVVCGEAQAAFGLVVTAVERTRRLPVADLRRDGRDDLNVRGMTGDAITVLDGAALLEDQRLFK